VPNVGVNVEVALSDMFDIAYRDVFDRRPAFRCADMPSTMRSRHIAGISASRHVAKGTFCDMQFVECQVPDICFLEAFPYGI
jgi:hypothetical protein